MIRISWRAMVYIVLSLPAFVAGPGWPAVATAAPAITSLTGTPSLFPPKVKLKVEFTVTVSDPTFNPRSAQLERQQVDGSWQVYTPIGLTQTSTPLVYTGKVGFNEPTTGLIRVRLRGTFSGQETNKFFSPVFVLNVGQSVTPSSQDQTIQGGGGTSITIPGGSLLAPTSVGISPAPASVITAPSPLTRAATVDIVFQAATTGDGLVLAAPLLISVPAPAGTPSTAHFDFVQEAFADSPTGGLTKQLHIVDSGIVSGGQIVSDTTNPILPGIFGGGAVAIFQVQGSGYLIGRVVDSGSNGLYGVSMQDTFTGETWTSEKDGSFIVKVSASDNYNIRAIDGFRCVKLNPELSGNLTNTSDGTVQNIGGQNHKTLTNPLVINGDNTSTPSRGGIRNAGFEVGIPTNCWRNLTAGQLIQQGVSPYRDAFNFSPPIAIDPSEGNWMAALTNTNTAFEQEFLLPSLVDGTPSSDFKKLRFDYIFACTGSCPTPSSNAIGLQAEILPVPSGAPLVSASPTFKQFNGQLGWRTAELDVRNITAGTQVKLKFTVTGAAANTAVLIDNIRFDTVTVIANIVTNPSPSETPGGAATDIPNQTTSSMVPTHVRYANEILSQAGVTLRLRQINATVNPNDTTCNPTPFDFFHISTAPVPGTDVRIFSATQAPWDRSPDLRALTCLGPNLQPTDPVSNLHVYYVNLLSDGSTVKFGLAVSPEEYQGEGGNPLTYDASDPFNRFNASAILLSAMGNGAPIYSFPNQQNIKNQERETLAHETGHVLLHTTHADDSVEHGSPALNIMNGSACVPRYTSTVCASRPFFTNTQSVLVDPPNPPPGPRCPVTCQH